MNPSHPPADSSPPSSDEHAYFCGFAEALSLVFRLSVNAELIREVMDTAKITVSDLENARVPFPSYAFIHMCMGTPAVIHTDTCCQQEGG